MPQRSPISTSATVYFIRTKNFPHTPGNGVLINIVQDSRAYNVFADSEFVCALNQYSYISHKVPAGKHHFSVRLNSRKFKATIVELSMDLEAGKIYYLEVVPGHQKLNSPLECNKLSEYIGSNLILDMKEDKKCKTEE